MKATFFILRSSIFTFWLDLIRNHDILLALSMHKLQFLHPLPLKNANICHKVANFPELAPHPHRPPPLRHYTPTQFPIPKHLIQCAPHFPNIHQYLLYILQDRG